MITGLYSSVGAKMAGSENQDIISRNLANINTTGFKKNVGIFSNALDAAGNKGVKLSKLFIDHEQGSLKETGNKLDLAIHGKGFFVLESPDGLKFSRNGHFLLNSESNIVNSVGWKLKGKGGDFKLPPGTKTLSIDVDGNILADEVQAGKIKIVDFENKEDLIEAGNSSFFSKSKSAGIEASNFKLQQGYLENSNVNVIDEMVSLMANQRGFQGNNRVNKTMNDTLQKLIRTAYTVI